MASIVIHRTHGQACIPNRDSCYAQRQPHVLIEFIGATFNISEKDVLYSWVDNAHDDLKESGLANKGTYVALLGPGVPNEAWYGENWEKLKAMKQKMDEGNTFEFALPSLV